MGVRFPSAFTTTTANALPANATETAILVTPPLSPPLDNAQVFIHWYFVITAGTGTTGLVTRVRRGSGTGGTVIGFSTIQTLAAGNSGIFCGLQIDNSPGIVAGQQYSLTVVQTGATAAGSTLDNAMIAYVL